MDEIVGTQPPVATEIQPSVVTGDPSTGVIDTPPDPAALQSEIDRLQEVKTKAQLDAEYWRKQKAQARAEYFRPAKEEEQRPSTPPAVDLGIGPPPSKDDFDDYEKYNDAKIAFEVRKARAQWERDDAVKQAQTNRQQRMGSLQEKINQGFEKYPDFEEVAMDQSVPITPVILDILAETESPADIAYYLGKNRSEAIQIARMTPIQAVRAIARIEAEIVKNPNPNPTPTTRTITGAPPPLKPIGSTNPTIEKDPAKMSQKEYEAWAVSRGAHRF